MTENVNSENGNMLVEGVLATAEVKNGNGRYYSKELWDREMDKYSELIKERRSIGELDHPESSVINLQNVSHIISEYWWDGDNVMGKIEILPTPSGNILKEIIKAGVTVGVSSRGMGSLEQNGNVMEVQDDFELLCWDFVSTPSNPGSYMHTLNEGKEEVEESYDEFQRDDKGAKGVDKRNKGEEDAFGAGVKKGEKIEKKKMKKKAKKESLDNDLAEIDKQAQIVALEAKLAKIDEVIEGKTSRINMVSEDENLAELMDKKKLKEMQKEVKVLEKRKAKMEKMYEKMAGKSYQREEIVDETTVNGVEVEEVELENE